MTVFSLNDMRKSIAVIYGSDSSEWEVSVRSGEFTSSQIDGSKYDVYEVFARFGDWSLRAYRCSGGERVVIPEEERPQICKCDFSVVVGGAKVKFDYAPCVPPPAPQVVTGIL